MPHPTAVRPGRVPRDRLGRRVRREPSAVVTISSQVGSAPDVTVLAAMLGAPRGRAAA